MSNDSENAAIRGCINNIDAKEKNGSFLIMDCGQSLIKRSIVTLKENAIIKNEKLAKIEAKYVDWIYEKNEDELKDAKLLNNYIKTIILNTIKQSNVRLENQIIISIANYVNNGILAYRGGYGKLNLIISNYEKILEKYLYETLNDNYKVKLIHDGTAMANAFKKYKNSVCISLGTVLGVGFTTD